MKYILAGGGTGGHLVPAISLANEIRKQDREAHIIFICDKDRMGKELIEKKGFKANVIEVYPLFRSFKFKTLKSMLSMVIALFQSLSIIRNFQPDIVVGTGGYVSGPVILGAFLMGVPTAIQEQNSIPGLTSRALSLLAQRIYLGFPQAALKLHRKNRIEFTGNPIDHREPERDRKQILSDLDFDGDAFTLLVTGGSQGARSLNQALSGALTRGLLEENIQVIWQTGKLDYGTYRNISSKVRNRSVTRPFFDNMNDYFSIADLVVCRAGALTLSEIAAWGLPAILVPYPYATANHQYWNARYYSDKGHAILVEDSELTDEKLAYLINAIINDPGRRESMGQGILELSSPGACKAIIKSLMNLAKTKKTPGKHV
ncbi:undecaprenyldiphospho-muramoylpentapeptide beta-N-acetylglucosaminyltransferase [bacterium]|nr:undecaprenyldiphospho-muramoylpentapeptide beta-N-acetylglucosaminyltransferase [bacterium]